jgi:hypothetical protein
MPLVEARRHLPVAQLEAVVREFITPRYTDPDPNPPKEPPRQRKPWSPLELLPWYASFGEAEQMTPAQAESLAAAFDGLPEWCKAVAPIEDARALLSEPETTP